jgi:hypothetical protein
MLCSYLDIYLTALENYTNQKPRAGYTPGLFSCIRHSCYEYSELVDFRKSLQKAPKKEIQKKTIEAFLFTLRKQGKINNHSFASYFLDALIKDDPTGRWECFYPDEKKIVFYSGTLYRGMRIDFDVLMDIFANGLKNRKSSVAIDDYISDASLSMGISTSKNKTLAGTYALGMISRGYKDSGKVLLIDGYLLEIDYNGLGGIDIMPTLAARGHHIRLALAKQKQEVNIIGDIPASCIKGAYHVTHEHGISKEFYYNPNYHPSNNESNITPISLAERLETIMPMSRSSRFC